MLEALNHQGEDNRRKNEGNISTNPVDDVTNDWRQKCRQQINQT